MSAIPLQYINATAAIGYRMRDRSVKFTGSGFVYSIDARESEDDERAYHSFIVTNRHVVEPLSRPYVRQSYLPTVERPEWLNVRGDCEREMWTMHPDDKVDVAVYPVHTADRGRGPEAFHNDIDVLHPLDMAEAEVIEGSEIYVLGFPLGLVDESRILDWYEGITKCYLIDSLNYPGNSGGPVIAKDDAKFVGMISAYLPYRDTSVSRQTGLPVMNMTENSGLAIVMPPGVIEETIDLALGRGFADVGQKTDRSKRNERG